MMSVCHHCQQPRRTYDRGLCYRCEQIPGIRSKYPVEVRGRSGLGLDPAHAAAQPTPLPPGPDKVQVLMDRAQQGLELWSQDDGERDWRE
jgi:hypothetical protein